MSTSRGVGRRGGQQGSPCASRSLQDRSRRPTLWVRAEPTGPPLFCNRSSPGGAITESIISPSQRLRIWLLHVVNGNLQNFCTDPESGFCCKRSQDFKIIFFKWIKKHVSYICTLTSHKYQYRILKDSRYSIEAKLISRLDFKIFIALLLVDMQNTLFSWLVHCFVLCPTLVFFSLE